MALTRFHRDGRTGQRRYSLEAHLPLAPVADRVERSSDLPDTVDAVTSWPTGGMASVAREPLLQLVGMVLTLYMLFYFLRDRRGILAAIESHFGLPAGAGRCCAHVRRHYRRHCARDRVRHLIVAMVQGILGGLMFWWLGLLAPLLWGVLMGLLAVASRCSGPSSSGSRRQCSCCWTAAAERPCCSPWKVGRGRWHRQRAVSDAAGQAPEAAYAAGLRLDRRWPGWCSARRD
ncbi:MAG: AI-2E family transporter [Thermomonas sp.]|nr:AI-2E family transporter [Thermomonas sp.]